MTEPDERTKDVDVYVRYLDVYGNSQAKAEKVAWDRTGMTVWKPEALTSLIAPGFCSLPFPLVAGVIVADAVPEGGEGAFRVMAVLFGAMGVLFTVAFWVRTRALKRFMSDWSAHFDSPAPRTPWQEWTIDGTSYRIVDGEVVSLPAHRDPRRHEIGVGGPSDTTPRYTVAAEQHEQVKTAYGAILADPIEVLLHSALMDTTNPHTEQFVLALYSANDLATATRPSNVAEVEQYAAAVHRLRVAWDNARGFAEKHGAAWMPGVDQERVDTALGLLRHGASPGLSDTERITYLTKAYTLIRDISVLRLDPRTVAALDAATGKAITG